MSETFLPATSREVFRFIRKTFLLALVCQIFRFMSETLPSDEACPH
jgi:hypothetical protein